MANNDDFYRDIENLFDQRDKPKEKPINWDDYNFNFDDEIPSAGAQAPQQSGVAYSHNQGDATVESMRRVHNGEEPYPRQARTQSQAPAEGRYVRRPERQAAPAPSAPPEQTRGGRRKKRIGCFGALLRFVAVILGLLILFAAGLFLFAKMPQTDQPIGARKKGVCTVLLCGTDLEGTRTDTMMLLYIDRPGRQLKLLSLPRDTMVNRTSSVPKLNGAYGANGAGEAGMDVLMGYVQDLVGYRPDGYMLIDLNCFEDLVNTMGGVRFDVPMDMHYEDPEQDLFIDLKQGMQSLSGEEAMWLVRFRSGYTMADLDRVNVQRSFLSAAMKQWTNPVKLIRAPLALRLVSKHTLTDLDLRNLCWIVTSIALCGTDDLRSDTLPGEPEMVNGGSYYVEDREAAAALINAGYDPYESEISAYDLHPYGY